MKYDVATLQGMAGQCRSAASDSQSRTAGLSSRINGDVTSGWEAASANAFLSLYQQWRTSANGVEQALSGIGQLLDQTAVTVVDTDAAITRGFSQAM